MSKKEPVSVKLGHEAYRKAKAVCGWKNVGLVEYLTEVVEAAADRDLDHMEKERAQRRRDAGKAG